MSMSDTSWGVWDYPEPPAEKPRPICPRCKGEMGDKVYFVEGEFRCEDCFDDYVSDMSRDELAKAMDIEVLTLEEFEDEHF